MSHMLRTIEGPQLRLRILTKADAQQVVDYRNKNREFFQPFQPLASDDVFTVEYQSKLLEQSEANATQDAGYLFGIFLPDERLIGHVQLSGIARGPFQNAFLGYALDLDFNGRGFTTEAVRLVVQFAFQDIHLHRIQAAVMPRNHASIRVLEKCGFVREGHSRNYLKINGVWEDHTIYAVLAEDTTLTVS